MINGDRSVHAIFAALFFFHTFFFFLHPFKSGFDAADFNNNYRVLLHCYPVEKLLPAHLPAQVLHTVNYATRARHKVLL